MLKETENMSQWQKALRLIKTDMRGPEQVLGELESAVMEACWTLDEINVTSVHQYLLKSREIAYTTAQTILDRLCQKGLLKREMRGRNYTYFPSVSRQEFMLGIAKNVLRALLGNVEEYQFASLIEGLSESDQQNLERLKRLIEEQRNDT